MNQLVAGEFIDAGLANVLKELFGPNYNIQRNPQMLIRAPPSSPPTQDLRRRGTKRKSSTIEEEPLEAPKIPRWRQELRRREALNRKQLYKKAIEEKSISKTLFSGAISWTEDWLKEKDRLLQRDLCLEMIKEEKKLAFRQELRRKAAIARRKLSAKQDKPNQSLFSGVISWTEEWLQERDRHLQRDLLKEMLKEEHKQIQIANIFDRPPQKIAPTDVKLSNGLETSNKSVPVDQSKISSSSHKPAIKIVSKSINPHSREAIWQKRVEEMKKRRANAQAQLKKDGTIATPCDKSMVNTITSGIKIESSPAIHQPINETSNAVNIQHPLPLPRQTKSLLEDDLLLSDED